MDFLEAMNGPAHKIASFDLVDTCPLRKVAGTGKPVSLSTGMAPWKRSAKPFAPFARLDVPKSLYSNAPAPIPSRPEDMNLRIIPHLAETFDLPVGLFDHTLGIAVPVAAVALGACIIEKHMTLRRSDGGPDAPFSLEPDEFRAMVDAVRTSEQSFGRVCYPVSEKEQASRVFRRSLFVVEDIKKGEKFSPLNLRSIRSGSGLPPEHLNFFLGKSAASDLGTRGSALTWDMLNGAIE